MFAELIQAGQMPDRCNQKMTVDIREFIHHHQCMRSLIQGQFIVLGKGIAENAPVVLFSQNIFHPPWGPHCLHVRITSTYIKNLPALTGSCPLEFQLTLFGDKTQPFFLSENDREQLGPSRQRNNFQISPHPDFFACNYHNSA